MQRTPMAWSAVHDGERIEMKLTEEGLYFEVGSDQNVSKRNHEGQGGTMTVERFRENPMLFKDFPGFYERVLADLDGPNLDLLP